MSLSFRERLKLRWKRKRLLWRAFRSRRALTRHNVQTKKIFDEQILCFAVLRNEAERLPHFLEYHRKLGVGHFLIVVNASTDDSLSILEAQPDVSVWTTSAGYKAARFGMNWTNWLLRKYGTGKWCLTLDADELLVYPHMETQTVAKLCGVLDARGEDAFGALMIDLYPKGPLGSQKFQMGQNPLNTLPYFDPHPHRMQRQLPMNNLWVQGGVRDRVFFSDQPARAPTLNKIPLVKWRRSYVYVNSTHSMLPRGLNRVYDKGGKRVLSGALLHTKFLPSIVKRSKEEKARAEHFGDSPAFDHYYDAILEAPDLWEEASLKYEDWRQLESLGFLASDNWTPDQSK